MILTAAATCLALNIYYEARNETIDGQIMVAEVTLNRVKSKKFPSTICEVVHQDNGPKAYDCQFSWFCDGKADIPRHKEAWKTAQQVAVDAMEFTTFGTTATHYHVCTIKKGVCKKQPFWASKLELVGQVGSHRFYFGF